MEKNKSKTKQKLLVPKTLICPDSKWKWRKCVRDGKEWRITVSKDRNGINGR